MDTKDALKWAVYYRSLAGLSFVAGLAIAAAGVWFGVGEALLAFAGSPLKGGGDAVARANPLVTVVATGVGVVVWQVGSTAAFVKTVDAASGESAVDEERLRSEIVTAVDDRVSSALDAAETGDTSGSAVSGGETDDGGSGETVRPRSARTGGDRDSAGATAAGNGTGADASGGRSASADDDRPAGTPTTARADDSVNPGSATSSRGRDAAGDDSSPEPANRAGSDPLAGDGS